MKGMMKMPKMPKDMEGHMKSMPMSMSSPMYGGKKAKGGKAKKRKRR